MLVGGGGGGRESETKGENENRKKILCAHTYAIITYEITIPRQFDRQMCVTLTPLNFK